MTPAKHVPLEREHVPGAAKARPGASIITTSPHTPASPSASHARRPDHLPTATPVDAMSAAPAFILAPFCLLPVLRMPPMHGVWKARILSAAIATCKPDCSASDQLVIVTTLL
jgi:hypothetical protein